MNTNKLQSLALCAFAALALGFAGFAQEVAHTETDKPNFFGGRTHEETTVVKNPDGSISTYQEKQVVK